jgi:hypothetical protein
VLDSVFRFLASLKLAVISLSTLAGVLAYATFYEKWYGTSAVQDEIYQSPGFAVLLAFLGMNILCAALIRYPWTRRQTGFVITHAGLLIVLLGSWISFSATDDGQVGMVEGDRSEELVRIDHEAIWVQPVDPGTGQPKGETGYKLSFHPGSFPWQSSARSEAGPTAGRGLALGLAAACGLALAALGATWIRRGHPPFTRLGSAAAAGALGLGTVLPLALLAGSPGPRREVLTTASEPFQLVVKDYHPASTPIYYTPLAGEGGLPMLKASLFITPPDSDQRVDLFRGADDGTETVRWFKASDPRYDRAGRDLGLVLFTFQYARRPEMLDDFLALPPDPLRQELVRLHYSDDQGQPRVHDWTGPLAKGMSVELPGSDIRATIENMVTLDLDATLDPTGAMLAATGESSLSFLELMIQKGDQPAAKYIACSSLPALPNKPGDPSPLVRLSYFHPPRISQAAMQGRSSVVDVLATPDGKLHYRSFSRDGLRGKGPIEPGQTVDLVTKSTSQPVTFSLRVDSYLPEGVDGYACDLVELPPNQRDSGIPAALLEMSAGGTRREFWVRRMHPSHDFRHLFRPPFDFEDADADQIDDRDGHVPRFHTVKFPDGAAYRVALDFDRRPLGFALELTDFEMGTDPGTQQAASYQSDVVLTDITSGVSERPIAISMNEPLTWKDYTFYQANFDRVRNARGQETGQFISVFQVRFDPAWCWGTVYGGCLLVVIGTFVQFYMRAGVFNDGGKKERQRRRGPVEAAAPLPGEPEAATAAAGARDELL